MQESIVIIGAGSAMFTRGTLGDIIARNWEGELTLVDIDPVALQAVEKLSRKMIAERGAKIKLRSVTDRSEALTGATIVIVTIGVGGRRAWEKDVFIPRKYGVYQPVGDCVMPGGASRALRMIPALLDIAMDVEKYCPNAIFFNYSNPMSACCRAVRKEVGGQMIGLCHGIFHTAGYIAKILGIPPCELKYLAAGINHLSWFIQLRHNGLDLMPRLLEEAKKRSEAMTDITQHGSRFAENGSMRRDDFWNGQPEPWSWQLVKYMGAFPAVMDRHVLEFFPSIFSGQKAYYGKTSGVDAFSFEECIEYGDKIFAEMSELAESTEALPQVFYDKISGEHEQFTEIAESIRYDKSNVFYVNLPNAGQVPNLPFNAVVESPSIVDAAGFHPIICPPLSKAQTATLATPFAWVELIVEAAVEGSRDKFIQALLVDGSIKSFDTAEKLADELLAEQLQYLPQFKH